MERAIARGAAGAGSVLENLGGVIGGEFRPACRFAERAAPWADGDPRIGIDENILDRHDEHITALGAFDQDRSADRVSQRRHAVEAGALAGNLLVTRRPKEAG